MGGVGSERRSDSEQSNVTMIWNGIDDGGWPVGATVRCSRCDGVVADDGTFGEHGVVRCDLPTREYQEVTVNGKVFPAGSFADFHADVTRRVAHEIRSVRPEITNKKLALLLGCQRPVHAHRAYEAWRLRLGDASARTGGRGDRFRQLVDDPISPEVRDLVFWMQGGRCAKCDCRLAPSPGLDNSFHVDHIRPQTWFEDETVDHSPANLQPLCRRCNTVKGDTEDKDYRSEGARARFVVGSARRENC